MGLFVRALRRITTDHFDVYFHLWRDGGADGLCEWRRWKKDEEDSWTTKISRKNKCKLSSKKVSFSKKLVLDSLVSKSRPKELSSVIKVGDLFCPVPVGDA